MAKIHTLADLIDVLRRVSFDDPEWDHPMIFDGEEYDSWAAALASDEDRPGYAEAKAYGEAVRAMQREVFALRDQIIAALEAGDLHAAQRRLNQAASLEREFGAANTYGPLAEQADSMTLVVEQYAGDGAAPADLFWREADSLDEARRIIAKRVTGDLAALRWDDPTEGLVEAYHESDAPGCGGYVIRIEAA